HGWTPGGIVQRTARTPARRQNGPRPGTHLGTSAAPATESEYCSRFPYVLSFNFASNNNSTALGLSPSTDQFDIYWNGSQVGHFDPSSSSTWASSGAIDITGGAGMDTL